MSHAEDSQINAKSWDRLLAPAAPLVNPPDCAQLTGKRVLITGAAGSIGSALAHAALACEPESLIVLDTSENGLYELDRSLRAAGSREHLPLVASVCDRDALERLLARHKPQIVFHSAAFKHVPLMEQNPFAAILNNAFGTLTLARAAPAWGAEALVMVSTDKAADPSSIMGASKRIAELILLRTGGESNTHMLAVRLGNVAGSQGSVLPLFLEQIARGGPVTVTHRDAQRYFMTMDRAVAALFAALAWQASPVILVPELLPPVRILDLARRLLATHRSSVQIEFTGLRPGDKLSESLLASHEHWADSADASRSGLRAVASPPLAPGMVDAALDELFEAAVGADLSRLMDAVAALVPEYQPAILTGLSPTKPRPREALA